MKRRALVILLVPLLSSCARFKPTMLKEKQTIETTAAYYSSNVEMSARHLQDTDLSSTSRDISEQLPGAVRPCRR